MKSILAVAAGGAIGTVARYLIHRWVDLHDHQSFPWSTFIINISGCFLIGVFYAAAIKHEFIGSGAGLFLIVGICGGFTTFSTFAFENHELIKSGNYSIFLLYSMGSVIAGLMAVVAGMAMIRWIT